MKIKCSWWHKIAILRIDFIDTEFSILWDRRSLFRFKLDYPFCLFTIAFLGLKFDILWNSKKMRDIAEATYNEVYKETEQMIRERISIHQP